MKRPNSEVSPVEKILHGDYTFIISKDHEGLFSRMPQLFKEIKAVERLYERYSEGSYDLNVDGRYKVFSSINRKLSTVLRRLEDASRDLWKDKYGDDRDKRLIAVQDAYNSIFKTKQEFEVALSFKARFIPHNAIRFQIK